MTQEYCNSLQTKILDGRRYLYWPRLWELGLKHYYTTIDDHLKIADCPDPERLAADQARICSYLGGRLADLKIMFQTHSATVLDLGRTVAAAHGPEPKVGATQYLDCDGLVTASTAEILASSYADCVPLLLFDPKRRVQANVHSGWRGTLASIVRPAIQLLVEHYGSAPAELYLAIGPHIGPEDFEVRHDVSDQFRARFPQLADEVIRPKNAEQDLIDLAAIIRSDALALGLQAEHLLISDWSTVAHPELLHSFRRDGRAFQTMRVFSKLADSPLV